MKHYAILLITALLITFPACEKERFTNATVMTNCTGKYIKTGGKIYLICNEESLKDFKHGDEIRVTYKVIESPDECSHLGYRIPYCYLYTRYDEMAKILSIQLPAGDRF